MCSLLCLSPVPATALCCLPLHFQKLVLQAIKCEMKDVRARFHIFRGTD
ncbi:hypothetical protein PAHAL_2G362700 [Panicum hallii]|uniref:Uncharacterized protein n=1 Tax=Panicum hallii TaxID=206008 RepID=A0A2S3H216_9POAL|nr:hypothetical protein PAHAL_2G362700 [Panicum hallii]